MRIINMQRTRLILIFFVSFVAVSVLSGCNGRIYQEINSLIIGNQHLTNCATYSVSAECTESSIEISSSEILHQIKKGDFVNVTNPKNDENLLESLQRLHGNLEKGYYEWLEFDITGDGANELIAQTSDYVFEGAKRIVAIFTMNEGSEDASIVYFQTAGLTRFLFLSKNGNIILFDSSSGVIVQQRFAYVEFDENWNLIIRYALQIIYVDDISEVPKRWLEENPLIKTEGIFFFRDTYISSNELLKKEVLCEKEFIKIFEELTGLYFEDVRLH